MNPRNEDAHANNAWTDKTSGKHWLRDFLPSRIPNANIWAYQYNAKLAFGASTAGVEEQAKNMLHCLSWARKYNNTRPIIFIAHSMGGIIVKEALVSAHYGDGTHAMISTLTYGIAFFGVPHRGTESAKWGKIAASIIGKFSLCNESFLNSVESSSAYNRELTSKFQPLLERYRFLSICETLPDAITGSIIVTKESAILGLPDYQDFKCYPNRTHVTICKFASESEPGWIDLSKILYHASMSAVESFNYSPTALESQKMFKNHSWYREEETPQPKFSEQEAITLAGKALVDIRQAPEGLSELQFRFRELMAVIQTIVAWLAPIILGPAFPIISLFLRKQNIMDRVEEARKAELEAVKVEQQTIKKLDAQRYCVMQVIGMLRNSCVLDDENTRVFRLCQRLDKEVVRLVGELHDHNRTLRKEQITLKLIEEGQKKIEGMEMKEIVTWAREKKADLESISASKEEETTCPMCVIL